MGRTKERFTSLFDVRTILTVKLERTRRFIDIYNHTVFQQAYLGRATSSFRSTLPKALHITIIY